MPEPAVPLKVPDKVDETEFEVEARMPAIDFETMPVRSLRVPSEDLEHTEDKYLDSEFEEALKWSGDDLGAIPGGETVLANFFGAAAKPAAEDAPKAGSTESRENNKAVEIAARLSEDEDDDDEMPELPADPTEEQLLEYASKHPAVKSVARLFRGKVISVRKRS